METIDAYDRGADPADHEPRGPLMRVSALLSQWCCRHDYVRRVGEGRLYLECLTCHRTTAGVGSVRESRSCISPLG
jgi:hypothetical protein